jgi:hypothetical protein
MNIMLYGKINTLFKRDEAGNIIPDQLTEKNFELLKDTKWECTEKVDGTNIAIVLNPDDTVEFFGHTVNAIIPPHLLSMLKERFTAENLKKAFHISDSERVPITLFGEGFGYKIQKYGNRYNSKSADFILFDIFIGGYWLTRESCESIASLLGIAIVPIIGYFTIPEAIEYVKKGFKSIVAEDPSLDAEGLVLRTTTGLLDRQGKRIITKLKTCDFRKLERAQQQ